MALLPEKLDKPLNLFYEEPDPDRWVKFDRYPRRLIRRMIRGKQRPGGVMIIALNLMQGLDKIGASYRFNDYKYIKNHPDEIACIIGKPHVLFDRKWANPVILGAGVYSHPIEYPNLFELYPQVKRFLVPGEWMRKMFEPYYHEKVIAWPTGIDTAKWKPASTEKTVDFLIYDKVRWEHDKYENELVVPIIHLLQKANLSYQIIRYGSYTSDELSAKVSMSKAVIFLCEHETQGLAYQQILATNTPILAWDRGGFWQDPYYYPDKVKYQPVSAVPYWDDRCGVKFTHIDDFLNSLTEFIAKLPIFRPREFILENLTLEHCAQKYLDIVNHVNSEL